jgi:hypothetical protein
MNLPTSHPFIKWFADITIEDVPLVGGKNASLGEMLRELASKGVKVPDGLPSPPRPSGISSAKHNSMSASVPRSPTSTHTT